MPFRRPEVARLALARSGGAALHGAPVGPVWDRSDARRPAVLGAEQALGRGPPGRFFLAIPGTFLLACWSMKPTMFLGACLCLVLLAGPSLAADPIIDFASSTTGGTVSYAGGPTDPLIGRNIVVDSVFGL